MIVSSLYNLPNKISNAKISSIVYKINKVLLNMLYPLLARPTVGIDEESDFIISLTSFPDRIDTVWLTIMTLLRQKTKAYKIILWLAKEQFPNGDEDLPSKLISLKEYGLTIEYCEDLKPHKKYYYTMLKYPRYKVITVDDDVFYPEYLSEILLDLSEKYNNAVCCTRGHEITLSKEGHINKYSQWNKCVKTYEKKSLTLTPIGCGGVLYPPNCLCEDLFDKEQIRNLCLLTDDLWLKSMALLKYMPAIRVKGNYLTYMTIIKTQKNGLFYKNAKEGNNNDDSMSRILAKYPQLEKILLENKS